VDYWKVMGFQTANKQSSSNSPEAGEAALEPAMNFFKPVLPDL
jgi:hypothetical protein